MGKRSGKQRIPLDPGMLEETDHFRLLREFCADPRHVIAEALAKDET